MNAILTIQHTVKTGKREIQTRAYKSVRLIIQKLTEKPKTRPHHAEIPSLTVTEMCRGDFYVPSIVMQNFSKNNYVNYIGSLLSPLDFPTLST